MIEAQFDVKTKVFRSNNTKELRFTNYFSKTRTLHHFFFFFFVECLEHNLVVERKHQFLLNVACTLYFHSQVSLILV